MGPVGFAMTFTRAAQYPRYAVRIAAVTFASAAGLAGVDAMGELGPAVVGALVVAVGDGDGVGSEHAATASGTAMPSTAPHTRSQPRTSILPVDQYVPGGPDQAPS
jgi:hypothetical protein